MNTKSDQEKEVVISQAKEELKKVLKKIPSDALDEIIGDAIEHRVEGKGASKTTVVSQVSQHFFSGPIPPPKVLEEYLVVGKDIPNRIVKMAEGALDLIISTAKTGQEAEKRGQNYALIVTLAVIISVVFLIAIGKEIYGLIFGGVTLISLVSLFIKGRLGK